MPFVEAKCTNCGHTLKVDNSKDAAVCEFCGSAFIVEKAINNFNTYNQYQIEYANIQMADERSVEKRLENADVFFNKLNEVKKAKDLYLSVTEDSPSDYRGWWGVAQVLSSNFKKTNCGEYLFNEIKRYSLSALQFVSGDKLLELKSTYESFEKEHIVFIKHKKEELARLQQELASVQLSQSLVTEKLNSINKVANTLYPFNLFFGGLAAFCLIILFFLLCEFQFKGITSWHKVNAPFFITEIICVVLAILCVSIIIFTKRIKKNHGNKELYQEAINNTRVICDLKVKIDAIYSAIK